MLATPSTLKDMAGLLVVAAITPTFLYFAGLARTRASVATFAEMAQTFASLVITWGLLGQALSLQQIAAGAAAARRGLLHQPLRGGPGAGRQSGVVAPALLEFTAAPVPLMM